MKLFRVVRSIRFLSMLLVIANAGCPAPASMTDAGESPVAELTGQDAGDAQDAGAVDLDAGSDGGQQNACELAGISPVVGDFLTTSQGDFAFLYDGESGSIKKLQLELYGHTRTSDSFVLSGENFADCSVCLSIFDGCDGQQGECTRHFLAQSGLIELTTYNDTRLAGSISGVEAVEVIIGDDYQSTPVPGGAGWCLDSLEFNVVLPE